MVWSRALLTFADLECRFRLLRQAPSCGLVVLLLVCRGFFLLANRFRALPIIRERLGRAIGAVAETASVLSRIRYAVRSGRYRSVSVRTRPTPLTFSAQASRFPSIERPTGVPPAVQTSFGLVVPRR